MPKPPLLGIVSLERMDFPFCQVGDNRRKSNEARTPVDALELRRVQPPVAPVQPDWFGFERDCGQETESPGTGRTKLTGPGAERGEARLDLSLI